MRINFFYRNNGFTLLEILLVVFIIWLLATAVVIWVNPYFKRSRDTTRMIKVDNLSNVFDSYKKSMDKFPTNYGSGSSITKWFCITEIVNRPDWDGINERFTVLMKWIWVPPADPLGPKALPIPLCDMPGSYFYSFLSDGINDDTAIIAARLENQASANYGTGADLDESSFAQTFFLNSKKGTVQPSAPDAIYFRALR